MYFYFQNSNGWGWGSVHIKLAAVGLRRKVSQLLDQLDKELSNTVVAAEEWNQLQVLAKDVRAKAFSERFLPQVSLFKRLYAYSFGTTRCIPQTHSKASPFNDLVGSPEARSLQKLDGILPLRPTVKMRNIPSNL
jgi:hypothetical protein